MIGKVKDDLIWIMMCMTLLLNFIMIFTELVSAYWRQKHWKQKMNTSLTTQFEKAMKAATKVDNESQQPTRRPSVFIQNCVKSHNKIVRIT